MIDELAAIPLPDFPESERFWAGIERGTVSLPRCPDCHAWQWYPSPAGSCCGHTDLEWVDLPGTGTVFTYTVVHRPFLAELAPALPLTVGLITLDGAESVRFVASLDLGEPTIGQRVRLVVEPTTRRSIPLFREDTRDPHATA